MSRGGKRINCGRKKINGKNIKIKLEEETLKDLNTLITGTTQSDKLRKCIEIGLKFFKEEKNSESN